MFRVSSLWTAPPVNPVNNKARAIPLLNPLNMYGRAFFFAWFSFFICFWSWYAIPPLITVTIKEDLMLSQKQITIGNMCQLVATCVIRVTAGFACDRFGPKATFITILSLGSIPTVLAGTVSNGTGLIILRCFTGILGGALVPCEVYTTAFFDKNVVGAANAFAAGFANAGGGVTYFAMPAIYDSLVHRRGLSPHVAWRVSFIVPFILIITTAIAFHFLAPETPTGKWNARHRAINEKLSLRDMFVTNAKHKHSRPPPAAISASGSEDKIDLRSSKDDDASSHGGHHVEPRGADVEDPAELDFLTSASWELVQKPTVTQTRRAVFSIYTLVLMVAYNCTTGTESTILSFLGAYYYKKWPELGQTGSGKLATIFGLLNAVARPIGGMISDAIYRRSGSLWGRKGWIFVLAMANGAVLAVIGYLNPDDRGTLVGLIVLLAFTCEGGNGAVFALVPHVHPASNGIISGLTGASGVLGGVIFQSIATRYHDQYHMVLRIMAFYIFAANIAVAWIRPIPKNQLGGR